MNTQYQRKYLRAPVCCEALLNIEGDLHLVKVEDISEGGVAISAPHFLKSNTKCSLMLKLTKHPEYSSSVNYSKPEVLVLHLGGVILPKLRDVKDGEYKLGIYFTKIDINEMNWIKDYVKIASKNLNYLLSLELSNNTELEELKSNVASELGWFSKDEKNYQEELVDYQQNLQWT